jgi:hypothetical protein
VSVVGRFMTQQLFASKPRKRLDLRVSAKDFLSAVEPSYLIYSTALKLSHMVLHYRIMAGPAERCIRW